jgi:hypothetical protein
MLSPMPSYPSSIDPALSDSTTPQPGVCSSSHFGYQRPGPSRASAAKIHSSAVPETWISSWRFSFTQQEGRRDGVRVPHQQGRANKGGGGGASPACMQQCATAKAYRARCGAPLAVTRRRAGTRRRGWRAGARWDCERARLPQEKGRGRRDGLPQEMGTRLPHAARGIAAGENDGPTLKCHIHSLVFLIVRD